MTLSAILRNLPYHSLMLQPEAFDLKERKSLVKILRVRSNPNTNPFLATQTVDLSGKEKYFKRRRGKEEYISITDFFEDLKSIIFPSDILTATLMMLTRNYTLSSPDWFRQELENRRASFYKELGASQTPRLPSQIDYGALFGLPSHRGKNVSPYCPGRPLLQAEIYKHLCRWKNKCSEQILFPKTSRKSMGVLSSWEAIQLYDLNRDFGSKLSSEEVEYWYWRSGSYPGGPCEMRQAWFYNDLTPRTYYATGCGAHKWARYSQRIFNLLLDEFPFTHRFKRFNLDRIRLEKWETAIVYDYTSFTSLLNEHVYFVRALADFCRGTNVRIVDGPYGIVEMDLGEFLLNYEREAMDLVEFSLSEELAEVVGEEPLKVFQHQRASLLGINGNLASATGLHGLYLCHLTGSMEKCSCVGDDAIGVFEVRLFQGGIEEGEIEESMEERRMNFVRGLQVLGVVHSEKSKFLRPIPSFTFEDQVIDCDRWTYLKRSLDRYPNFLELGFLPAIPNVQVILQEQNTTRRMNFDESDPETMIPRIASQCFNLVKSHFHLEAFEEDEIRSSYAILRIIYDKFDLPRHGYAFMWRDSDVKWNRANLENVTFLPAIGQGWKDFSGLVRSHPIDHLVKMTMAIIGEGESLSVPLVVSKEFKGEAPDSASFQSTGGAAHSFGVKMGVMKKEVVKAEIVSEDLPDYMNRFMSRHWSILYTFTVLPDCPDWLVDILRG